jgi:hypothetical protein
MEKISKNTHEPSHNRRRFLLGLGAVGAAAAVGTALYKKFEGDEDTESIEGAHFEAEQTGYVAAATMGSNEILFVDENNVPVGAPIDFSAAIPEDLKLDGIAISPPPLSWRQEMARQLESSSENTGRRVARSHNVALDFKAALGNKSEPELVAGIQSGSIKSSLDIIKYFGQKPVRGVREEISRLEYVEQAFRLSNKVPSIVRDEIESELKSVMPGLCAKESKFNNSLTSGAGAVGIFQFMPNVWKSYNKNESDLNSLKEQTEVAGLLMSDMYSQLMHYCDDEALLQARDSFSNQSDFLKHFITPLIINSYNSGARRLATAVNRFFVPERDLDGLVGKDVYLAMADFAQAEDEGLLSSYKTDAREYVSRAYALSRVL